MIRTISKTNQYTLPKTITKVEEKPIVPFRFKMSKNPSYEESSVNMEENHQIIVNERDATEVLEAVQSIGADYLSFLLHESDITKKAPDFNMLGSGNAKQQKEILQYLVSMFFKI